MARSWMLSILCCFLVAAWQCQAAAMDSTGVLGRTKLGLALPGQVGSLAELPTEHEGLEDEDFGVQDAFADASYYFDSDEPEKAAAEKHEALLDDMGRSVRELVNSHTTQQQKQAEEIDAVVPQVAGVPRLAVPLELSVAQPVMAMAATITQEVRGAVEQAQSMAAQLMAHKNTPNTASSSQHQTVPEAAPVNIIELSSLAGTNLAAAGIEIDVTVTTEHTGSTWSFPSIFNSNNPAMFTAVGQDSSGSSSSKQGSDLAAEITQSVIESTLASPNAAARLADGQELILDMTVENAQPQTTERLVAAAAAAAASAAASASTKQPWESVELQMEVVETVKPFFKSARFIGLAMMFLSVQMMLCYAVSLLYSGSSEDEEEEEEEQEVDCKQHKCQQQHNDWAIMAEEGRGLYEKLLSYT